MSARSDAIVIGGGMGGLTAAAYLRQTGASVVLLEADEMLGGACRRAETFHALDPRMVKDLGLARHGLKFALRDMALVALRQDGRNLVLGRDPHDAARAIAAHSPADAAAYRCYQSELFALARAMRPWWWDDAAEPHGLPARVEAASAQAFLASYFESDALRAALAFDVPSPLEPGSALALVWRAAQEMCGSQGAVAAPQGGGAALADALIAAAKDMGVEFRAKARVARLVLDGDAVAGAELDSGETIFAPAVLSSLSRRETLLDLAPAASAGFAQTQKLMRAAPAQKETTAVFTLNAEPALAPSGARFVVAEGETALEAVVAACALPGQHVLSVRVKGLAPVDAIVAQLEHFIPLLRGRIVGIQTGERDVAQTRLLESARTRIATPIRGLFLCGRGAEPMDALSGRAGRLAADFVVRRGS
ncbi:MAG TPA: FAD-dependent oxidoreductase [Rhizomicrobium sp.]|jgi:phytoene dehydrogenase-like protein|nr:FAD-dependent oxidoreductase [Rhizomicrobium sp.]